MIISFILSQNEFYPQFYCKYFACANSVCTCCKNLGRSYVSNLISIRSVFLRIRDESIQNQTVEIIID